jgi:hypothetical protein
MLSMPFLFDAASMHSAFLLFNANRRFSIPSYRVFSYIPFFRIRVRVEARAADGGAFLLSDEGAWQKTTKM